MSIKQETIYICDCCLQERPKDVIISQNDKEVCYHCLFTVRRAHMFFKDNIEEILKVYELQIENTLIMSFVR